MHGADTTIATVYILYRVTVLDSVYNDFKDLLQMNRGMNKTYQNFEETFPAQIARFNAHGKTLALHPSNLVMFLLSGYNIDDDQIIPVFHPQGLVLQFQPHLPTIGS